MKWADLTVSFARPIHSILALLGDRVIPFNLGNIKSGRYTFGHSFVHPAKIKINHPSNYGEKLYKAHVLVDMDERKALLESEVKKATAAVGGGVLPDNELVGLVNNLVEYPVAVLGQFDEAYLKLPREILITAMREHQKYFAVIDRQNRLMPCFVAVNNTPVKDLALVAKGHERVLRARLEDAQFFYKSDLTESQDSRVERLQGVLFQAELGTVYEKVMRLGKLVEFLTEEVKLDSLSKKLFQRAAFLCKSDLVSQVVGEFPKLQGIMGKVYALNAGEPEAVAFAIEEHYRPTHSGGSLPESSGGAILSIADKIDTICGCFRVGLLPTGASDPYALRRQGIGIIQIMLVNKYSFSLRQLIEASVALFMGKKGDEFVKVVEKIYGFLRDRISYLLSDEGFSKDVIAAVVSVSVNHVPHVWKRVQALQALKLEQDFEPLTIAFKRVVNILKQARYNDSRDENDVDTDLFEHACEHDLLKAFHRVNQIVSENLAEGLFDKALLNIASLREPVDAFFDGVLVMTEDPKIRVNRLRLLGRINKLFGRFADFSKIST
jgi:glycyl-tRNA synthetase beta chain